MAYCDSRDQDTGVGVSSVQLWIISPLFLLWPTCSGRWLGPHKCRSYFLREAATGEAGWGSPYGDPYVIFKLSISDGDNLGRTRERDICAVYVFTKRSSGNEAELLICSHDACSHCWSLTSNFHLPWFQPGDVGLYGLHGRLPSALYFISFSNQFALSCSYSLCVAMDTAPK